MMPHGFSIGRLTLVTLSGSDRNKIANNLCTQDLRSLDEGQVVETFVTDVKGRTLSHGLVFGLQQRLWFVSSPGQAERLVPHWDRYIIREDAFVQDASTEWEAVLFLDPEACAQALGDAAAMGPGSFADRKCGSLEREGSTALWIQVPWVGPQGVLVLLPSNQPASHAWSSVRDACVESDTTRRSGWEHLRIRAFWPWYGVDCDERNLPQELAIDARAISFQKGCYLGQETVARLDAMGQVQKKLVPTRIDGAIGLELPYTISVDGKEIGTITSLANEPNGNGVALAMVRRSHFATGTVLTIENHRVEVANLS